MELLATMLTVPGTGGKRLLVSCEVPGLITSQSLSLPGATTTVVRGMPLPAVVKLMTAQMMLLRSGTSGLRTPHVQDQIWPLAVIAGELHVLVQDLPPEELVAAGLDPDELEAVIFEFYHKMTDLCNTLPFEDQKAAFFPEYFKLWSTRPLFQKD